MQPRARRRLRPPVPATPPVWAPTPISGFAPPPQPPSQEMVWIPQATSRIDSLMRACPSRSAEEEEHRKRTIVWSVGATLVVGMILGVLWLLRGQPPTATWEQPHRDEILTLKDDAESLALGGNDQQAYSKYQELERLGRGADDHRSVLLEELEQSWQRRDALFDRSAAPTAPPRRRPSPNRRHTEPAPPPEAIFTPVVPQSQNVIAADFSNDGPGSRHPSRTAPTKTDRSTSIRRCGWTSRQSTDSPMRRSAQAIGKGVDYLLAAFSGPELANLGNYEHYEGLDTLAVYALMQAELATHDKRLDIHSPFMIERHRRDEEISDGHRLRDLRAGAAGDGAGALRSAAGSPDDSGRRGLAAAVRRSTRSIHLQQRISAGWRFFVLGQFQFAIRAAGDLVRGGSGHTGSAGFLARCARRIGQNISSRMENGAIARIRTIPADR